MQSSKTFRLFISSTFSDFSVEREVLQGEVFAEVKEYCKERGYIFLPIDLRWGVNEEAQVDQKTLELCLREVQACKSYPYPNFLLMLGDRYGWVPLPYSVESKEFREILSKVPQSNHKYLLKWYEEDLNQIPASYILKERYGEFVEYEKWEKEESRLRDILQSAVVQTNISEQERRKYFLSATEAEIEEGIIPYITPTKFQQKLLKEKSYLKDIDTENIFGFFRTIEPSSKKSDHFIAQDNQEAKILKQRVKDTLIQENILEITTAQTDEKSLDTNCIEEFKQRVTSFLKAKVDEQIAKERSFEPLSIEIQSQEYFAKQKRANFVGQEDGLAKIREYIDSQEQTPLVIYGKSGTGKSALMAKAIQEAKKSNVKVVYRFIGATPNSTSTKEILVSIFEELGIQIQEQKSQNLQDSESFEDFSYRVYNEIIKLKNNIVIFIDAIDQLQNEDEFLWLPKTLPTNVKIIISALNDTNYKVDSKYFTKLKQKAHNLYEMPPFDKPLQMLENLLKADNRTLQPKQKDYFLQKYNRVNRPLYIFVASKELKHWRSFENLEDKKAHKFQNLSNTQEGVIKEYIENLSTLYHHKKILVQRVLGYIYASRDGLSENEIIELLSTDKDFVKIVAPDTYHKNKSGGLPVVIWARLSVHLAPFLSHKSQDGEELLYFFHREFEDAVSKNPNQKILHEKLIGRVLFFIERNQNRRFDSNRWGKLYVILLIEYKSLYVEMLGEFKRHLSYSLSLPKDVKDINWYRAYIEYLFFTANLKNVNFLNTIFILDQIYFILHRHFKKNKELENIKIYCLFRCATICENINEFCIQISHKMYDNAFDLIMSSNEKDIDFWYPYFLYMDDGKKDKIIDTFLDYRKSKYQEITNDVIKKETLSLKNNNNTVSYIKLFYSLEKADFWYHILFLIELENISADKYFFNVYMYVLGQTISSCLIAKKYHYVEIFCIKYIKIIKNKYKNFSKDWMQRYAYVLAIQGISYKFLKDIKQSIFCLKESAVVYSNIHKENSGSFVELYAKSLIELKNVYALDGDLSHENEIGEELKLLWSQGRKTRDTYDRVKYMNIFYKPYREMFPCDIILEINIKKLLNSAKLLLKV